MVVVAISSVITAFVKIVLKTNISTSMIRTVELIRAMEMLVEDTNARMIKDLSLARVKKPLISTMKQGMTASDLVSYLIFCLSPVSSTKLDSMTKSFMMTKVNLLKRVFI